MVKFRNATEHDKAAVADIWHKCFEDDFFVIDKFLHNGFECYVAENDSGVPIAMLHFIRCKISLENDIADAVYLYAAATLPDYRKQGIMSALINYANNAAAERGIKFCILMPATEKLFDYYGKIGYYKFFKTKFVTVSAEELKAFSDFKVNSEKYLFDNITNLRFNIYKHDYGNVLWDKKVIKYAADMYEYYKGGIVTDGMGCMLCSKPSENVTEVLETVCTEKNFQALINKLCDTFKTEYYRFRLPVNSSLVKGSCETKYIGMIKCLGEITLDAAKPNGGFYLGLTLD